MRALAGTIGSAALLVAEQAGGMGVLAGRLLRRTFPPRIDGRELLRSLYKMGVQSLPIVLVTATFAGGIMVIQAGMVIRRYGAEGVLGWAAGFATLREIGPILIALMLSGRVGANNTAELGTMVVTEQFDALRTLAIDPLSYLVLPRVLSMVVVLFLLTVFGDAVALLGAALTGNALLGVSPSAFYRSLVEMLGFWDVATGLIKSVVFGVLIGVASCHFGLSVRGGAPGVGRAVNASVVASAAGVFVLDYLLTYLLR